MKTNLRALAIIKEFEGLRLKSYRCPAGIWSLGYGHTGPDVHPGAVIKEIEAEQLLLGDLHQFEYGVMKALDGADTSENEFSAMVSLAYNIGLGAFQKSSVLKFHRQGKKAYAANAFLLWVKAGAKRLPGLIKRRTFERGLYVS